MKYTKKILIYDNICQVAKQREISINSIEKETDLGTGSLCKWNTVSPTVRNLKKVADYLGVSIEELLADEKGG